MKTNSISTAFMRRGIITLLLALLVSVQSVWASVDISNAIIYNPDRFLNYSNRNYYSYYEEDLEVYAYDNGWKKLEWGRDFTFQIYNSQGQKVDVVKEKGCYTLTVKGTGDYRGNVSQSLYIVESGNWRNHKASSFSKIDSQNQVITITSEEELALLASHFNSIYYGYAEYSGWTFRLERDLDLSKYIWTPIGSDTPGEETGFQGHFDGQGHTIKGMHFDRLNSDTPDNLLYPQGLFAFVFTGSSVENLTLTESEIVSGFNRGVGGIAGYTAYSTTIKNCHVTPSVNVVCLDGAEGNDFSGNSYGGVVGYCGSNMIGCTSGAHVFKVAIAVECKAFGGIVGFHDSTDGQFTNCIYYGDQVFADSETGAIMGRLKSGYNKTMHHYYTSTTLKGFNGTDPSEIKKVESFDLDQVFDVDFGGAMTTQYDYDGIQVYPKAMVYSGVAYTLQENVTSLEGSGTATVPYLIKTTDDLDLVASYVNKGKPFTDKFFRLCNDLTYDGRAGNYTAIGYYEDGSNGCCFDGVFNGDNHCISGIYIHKDGTASADKYQGIFGWTGENAIVKDLMVRNCTFDGFSNTGAISGRNDGTITYCHVLDGVGVNAVAAGTECHGGIVGYNSVTGSVNRCSSSVSMSELGSATCSKVGGIIGLNEGTMVSCLALDCDIQGTTYVGTLMGQNSATDCSNNFYSACDLTIAGETMTTSSNIGCGNGALASDITNEDGAVPALRDESDNTTAITLMTDRTDYLTLNGFNAATSVDISGRTLFKDGGWNTLCLPFALSAFTGTPLDGATVMTLSDALFNNGTLTLNFVDATAIEAGKPYIVKWAKDTNHPTIDNPVFEGVTLAGDASAVETTTVHFIGSYNPLIISEEGDKKLLYMGGDNKVYYPNGAMNINAFRAYFYLQGDLVCGKPSSTGNINDFVLHFGDGETNAIENGILMVGNERDSWFTIDGRKLSGKPTVKGIYIHNGRKEAIMAQ